jgi:hypothetical protein
VTLAALIDTGALWRVVVYSLVAGVGVTFVFSLAIVGIARFDEHRRSGHGAAAFGYAALALIAALVVIGAVVEAIVVMTSK